MNLIDHVKNSPFTNSLEEEIEYLFSKLPNKERFIYLLKKGDVNLKECDLVSSARFEISDLRRRGYIVQNTERYTYHLRNKDHEWTKRHRWV